jgi:hypothetical protein
MGKPHPSRTVLFACLTLGIIAGCGATETPASPSGSAPPTATSSTAPPDADHQAIPRTRISLPVPAGLHVEASLPGLARPNSRTSVLVIEKPAESPRDAMTKAASGFSGAAAEAQGLKFDAPREQTIAGFPALVTTGSQRASGETFGKAVALIAAVDAVVIITGTLEPGDPLTVAELSAVLADARWSKETAPGDFGFDLTAAPGYERQKSSAGILLTRDGPQGPKLIAARSLGQTSISDRRGFAVQRFNGLPAAPTAYSVTALGVAGLSGFELIGNGKNANTVYMAILYTDSGYIVISGDYPTTEKYSGELAKFLTMAHSLVLK